VRDRRSRRAEVNTATLSEHRAKPDSAEPPRPGRNREQSPHKRERRRLGTRLSSSGPAGLVVDPGLTSCQDAPRPRRIGSTGPTATSPASGRTGPAEIATVQAIAAPKLADVNGTVSSGSARTEPA